MKYTKEILDPQTGELVTIDIGEWITITELGQRYNTGNRRTRTILRHMGFLQVEGGGKQHRHRLCPWVTELGWGKRLHPKHGTPFDVIGPDAQDWIAERWSHTTNELKDLETAPMREAKAALEAFREERNRYRLSHGSRYPEMEVVEMVSWLNDFYPRLSHAEIAGILDVTQQLVSRYLKEREGERDKWKAFRDKPLPKDKDWPPKVLLIRDIGDIGEPRIT